MIIFLIIYGYYNQNEIYKNNININTYKICKDGKSLILENNNDYSHCSRNAKLLEDILKDIDLDFGVRILNSREKFYTLTEIKKKLLKVGFGNNLVMLD